MQARHGWHGGACSSGVYADGKAYLDIALSDRRVLGRLKRERDYGRRFTKRENPVWMIEDYITYYNNRRVQRNLGVLTPMEKHYCYPLAA